MDRLRRVRNWKLAPPALLLACSTHAQATHPCAALADDVERLACYDAAFGPAAADARTAGTVPGTTSASVPLPSAPGSPPVAAAPPAIVAGSAATAASSPVAAAAAPASAAPVAASAAPSGAAPAVEPEAAFGFSEAEKRELAPETLEHEPEKRASIESTVTIVSNRRTGEFVYTLANGQIWIQTEADQGGYVRDGSSVSIKRAALGSYKLVAGNVSTRVRRVQ